MNKKKTNKAGRSSNWGSVPSTQTDPQTVPVSPPGWKPVRSTEHWDRNYAQRSFSRRDLLHAISTGLRTSASFFLPSEFPVKMQHIYVLPCPAGPWPRWCSTSPLFWRSWLAPSLTCVKKPWLHQVFSWAWFLLVTQAPGSSRQALIFFLLKAQAEKC